MDPRNPPLPTRDDVHARIMARLRKMSAEEGAQTLVDAGIYKPDGTLAEPYREHRESSEATSRAR